LPHAVRSLLLLTSITAACASSSARPAAAPIVANGPEGTLEVQLRGEFGWSHEVVEAEAVIDGTRVPLAAASGWRARLFAAPGPHHLELHLVVTYPCHPGSDERARLRRSFDFEIGRRPAVVAAVLDSGSMLDDPRWRFPVTFELANATRAPEIARQGAPPETQLPDCDPPPDQPDYPRPPAADEMPWGPR
jgi:hypothetical protein